MYVIYLDESGDSNAWSSKPQNNFVIGGIAIHEGQIRRLSEALDDIQPRFFPEISMPLKFHAVDIIGKGKGRFRSDLTENQRQQMMNDIYDVIANATYPDAVLFATAIDISSVTSSDQALKDTFEDIVQRVNTLLVRMNKADNPQKGMLIIDGNQSTEQKFRSLISEFRNTGHSMETWVTSWISLISAKQIELVCSNLPTSVPTLFSATTRAATINS